MARTDVVAVVTGIVSGILLCSATGALAFRGAGPGFGPGCSEPGIFRCIGSLDLTDGQRLDIEALQKETRDRIAPLRRELRELELPEALFAPVIDTTALEALLARKKSINADILDIRHEAMIAAVQLLTPGQRAVMLDRKKSRQMYGGRGRGGRGPAWGGTYGPPDRPWR